MSNLIKVNSSLKTYSVNFCDWKKFTFNKNDIFLIDLNLKNYFKNLKCSKVFIKASEQTKSYENIPNIIEQLQASGLSRESRLVAVGGGTVQDTAGFIASLIFRGIDWVFIPTTLIAQGDSCIGGKTSINLNGKKNQIGTFNPPSEIINDITFLETLPQEQILSGYGELLHYFLIDSYDSFLFYKTNKKQIKKLIYKALMIKKNIIEKDEFDFSERIILNYGHSFGHAIEGATEYEVPHGVAVAIGMSIANHISYQEGFLDKQHFNEMNEVLNEIFKNYNKKIINPYKVIEFLKKDKKNKNNKYGLILSYGIGKKFLTYFKFESKIEKYIIDYFKI